MSEEKDLRSIAELLIKAKRHKVYPWLNMSIKDYLVNGEDQLLRQDIERFPGLIHEAETFIYSVERTSKDHPIDMPYKPRHQARIECQGIADAVEVGIYNYDGGMFRIPAKDFVYNILILGQPGKGKTYANLYILDQLYPIIHAGKLNVLIFDIKGDYHNLAIKYQEYHFFEIEEVLHNFFMPSHTKNNDQRDYSKSIEIAAVAQYFHVITKPIIAKAISNLFSRKMPITIPSVVGEIESQLKKMKVSSFNKQHYERVTSRLGDYQDYPNFCVEQGFPLEMYMNENMIFSLRDLDQLKARHFIGDIMTKVLDYKVYHNQKSDSLKTLIVLDEGGWVFDAKQSEGEFDTNKFLEAFLRQSRAYGMGIILDTQQSYTVCNSLIDNSQNIISFANSPRVEEEHSCVLGLNDDQRVYLSHLEKRCAIVRTPQHPDAFEIEIPFLEYDQSSSQEEVSEQTKEKNKALLEKYGIGRGQKPESTSPASSGPSHNKPSLNLSILDEREDCRSFIEACIHDRFISETDLFKLAGLKKEKSSDVPSLLIEAGFLAPPVKLPTSKKPKVSYPLTIEAQDFLGLKDRISPAHFKHTYFCEVVKASAEQKGFAPKIEVPAVNPTTLETIGRFDLAARSEGALVTWEITLSFSSLTQNIQKCLLCKAALTFIICENKNLSEKARLSTIKYLREMMGNEQEANELMGRFMFMSLRSFLTSKIKANAKNNAKGGQP